MEKPFMNSIRPWKVNYEKRKKDIVIYSYTQHAYADERDYCPSCDEDINICSGQCLGDSLYHDKDQPAIPEVKIEDLNLQDILNMLPPNITISDVKMSLIGNDWGGIPYTTFSFFYEKEFPEDFDQFEIDHSAYEKEYAEYEIKRNLYDQWMKEQDIKELENKILKIKNG